MPYAGSQKLRHLALRCVIILVNAPSYKQQSKTHEENEINRKQDTGESRVAAPFEEATDFYVPSSGKPDASKSQDVNNKVSLLWIFLPGLFSALKTMHQTGVTRTTK